MSNPKTTIEEVDNGWVITVTEGDERYVVVYHTWEEVRQFLEDNLGDGQSSSSHGSSGKSSKPNTDPQYDPNAWDQGYPFVR